MDEKIIGRRSSTRDDIDNNEYEEWLRIDNKLMTMATETEDEIIARIMTGEERVEEEEESEDDTDEPYVNPSPMKEMRKALQILTKGLQAYAEYKYF
ncbi:hypothetical protein PGB90_006955 [Kerria lacca]